MKGLLAISALLAAIALGGWSASSDAAGGADPETITVRPGDQIRVAGAPIGCRVVRMKEFGGRVVIDCRRAGPLAGTYGTLISGREAVLTQFKSKRAAKQVVYATHHGDVRRCE